MSRVLVVGGEDAMGRLLRRHLAERPGVEECRLLGRGEGLAPADLLQPGRTRVVYVAGSRGGHGHPDLEDARASFETLAASPVDRVVVIASARAYDPSPHHPGRAAEERIQPPRNGNPIPQRWRRLEALARERLGSVGGMGLVLLRPAPTPSAEGEDYLSRLLRSRLAVTVAGHDPTLQLLALDDLVRAVACALESEHEGELNVAPRAAIPLHEALRLARRRRLAVPHSIQRAARRLLEPAGLARPIEELQYVRYSSTVSGERIERQLGFVPAKSSAEVVAELAGTERPAGTAPAERDPVYDDFGLDRDYVDAFGRTLFRFLHDRYWRIEVQGLEHVPSSGRAVLTGVHRGFQPWDGVMAVHLIASELGRYPRFLIHPSLLKFPFLHDYMTKLGGILACQENADWVLERDQLLGIFPEGIRGAFSLYRDAYTLRRFGRDEYVRMALRNRAPILPFVTVGSAEIFPILARIDWGWWKRQSEWPYFPITPTMGLVPLPSKWHTQFLAPIDVQERYEPEAAEDPSVVRMLSDEVRQRMRGALHRMLRRRRSVFFGTVFERPELEQREGAPG